jgi:hypothetical protein
MLKIKTLEETNYFFERIRILKYRHGLQARASGEL